ncbi:hypothetical protein H6A24_06175 [Bacteroides caecicola]|uniref:Uncharacterized protein n=1 Tax=Bacteroides caecicola TaxID=1462569 RepID=A0ABS2F770_9BACE|nr:hypothetical protein [Bacteroides caecicola]
MFGFQYILRTFAPKYDPVAATVGGFPIRRRHAGRLHLQGKTDKNLR